MMDVPCVLIRENDVPQQIFLLVFATVGTSLRPSPCGAELGIFGGAIGVRAEHL